MNRSSQLPTISRMQLRWFHSYVRLYVKRNFHGVHLLRLGDMQSLRDRPMMVCLNHPSWWDPLIGLLLTQHFFPDRSHYAPIADAGLQKYKFFERLGFFGIGHGGSGGKRFLEIGAQVLNRRDCALWVTPQGHFADVREDIKLQPGVGHLAARCHNGVILPIALEYAFWNERRPEAFACIGHPLTLESKSASASHWTASITEALAETQAALSALVSIREPDLFEPLLEGQSGIGGVYDFWRAAKARLQGKRFHAEHGRI